MAKATHGGGGGVEGSWDKDLPSVFFNAVQYFAHSGDVACLLAPQRMLLGLHNVNGDTALHTAIFAGRESVALDFVRIMHKDDLGVLNADGQTALHLAAAAGQSAVVRALVERGADITVTDTNGNTCIHLAKNVAVLRVVLRMATADDVKAALELHNHQGLTALHAAAAHGRLDLALELVARHGADVNAREDSTGRTPLHHAVRAGNQPVCELLLEFGADVNATDSAGNAPLHCAVQYDNFGISKLLVDFGADCVAANAYFQTPLDLAMHYGSTEASRAIMMFPSIRVPCKNLAAVAAAAFPALAQQAAPVASDASPAAANVPAEQPAPTPATVVGRAEAKPAITRAPSDAGKSGRQVRSGSEGEWQMLDEDDFANASLDETGWHMHRNKKLTPGAVSDKLAKYFNQKRKAAGTKDKQADTVGVRPVAASRPSRFTAATSTAAPQTHFANAPPATSTTSRATGPSNAKAEKARLAAQYGTPTEIAVATPPSLSTKEEKRRLEQKYQPKIALQVTPNPISESVNSGLTTKAVEAAASAAVNRLPAQQKFDELSTLD